MASTSSSSAQDAAASSSESSLTLKQKKQILRKEIRNKLKELSIVEINEQSNSVWEQVYQLDEYKNSESVGIFLSMPKNEINTNNFISRAYYKDSKILYVPQVGKNFELAHMEMVKVIEVDDEKEGGGSQKKMFYETWPRNKWNIPEPPESMPIVYAKPGDIDLLIVPGLGFDRQCNRLGQGKGYYDRFIERLSSTSDSTTTTTTTAKMSLVAVGLSVQLVEERKQSSDDKDGNGDGDGDDTTTSFGSIPVAEYDRPMDRIILPNEMIIRS